MWLNTAPSLLELIEADAAGLEASLDLAFCPTGRGGGVDNSCGSKGGGGSAAGAATAKRATAVLDEIKDKASKIKFVEGENDFEIQSQLSAAEERLKELDEEIDVLAENESDLSDYERELLNDFQVEYEELRDKADQLSELLENDAEFGGQELNTWFTGEPTEDTEFHDYSFQTDSGRFFKVEVTESKGGPADIVFRDQNGETAITGKGEAFQVFGKVVPAIQAYVDEKQPAEITFSAQGRSRIRLYERLISTMQELNPEYYLGDSEYNTGTARWNLKRN